MRNQSSRLMSYLVMLFSALLLQSCFHDTSPSVEPLEKTKFSLSGTISGLTGTIILQNNEQDDLIITEDGVFLFSSVITPGEAYRITIISQPEEQACDIVTGVGVALEDVSNIKIVCFSSPQPGPFTIEGSISGLENGEKILLTNKITNPKLEEYKEQISLDKNGEFKFLEKLKKFERYVILVTTPPRGKVCTVDGAIGIVTKNIILTIACFPGVTLGGTVTNMDEEGTIALYKERGEIRYIKENGKFEFIQAIESGETYKITILTTPENQECAVNNNEGVALENITNIDISCEFVSQPPPKPSTEIKFSVGGSVNGLILKNVLSLIINSDEIIEVGKDGNFVFSSKILDGSQYNVEIYQQPDDQLCELENAMGAIDKDVTNISVTCVALINSNVASNKPKTLTFNWDDIGTHHYMLLKSPIGFPENTTIIDNISNNFVTLEISAHLEDWFNVEYLVHSCDENKFCTELLRTSAKSAMLDSIGEFQSSNPDQGDKYGFGGDYFGGSIDISGDGKTIVVGASGEDSQAIGINGDQTDNSSEDAGAVYVLEHDGIDWIQQAYIKASNTEANDFFGGSISISSDGNTIAISATGEDSGSYLDGDQAVNNKNAAGAVYIYIKENNTWIQQSYIKPYNQQSFERFGFDIALSHDGDVLAASSPFRDAGGRLIGGGVESPDAGNVIIFKRNNGVWSEKTAILNSWSIGNMKDANYGRRIALSGGGDTLVTTSRKDVYVFSESGGIWDSGYKLINSYPGNGSIYFGSSIDISADGNVIVVGASQENSSATGVDGNQDDFSAENSGAVYTFIRNGSLWKQQAYLKASNTIGNERFGAHVSISGDGNMIAVNARLEGFGALGVNGDQYDTSAYTQGAVYVFRYNDNMWAQYSYVKSPINTGVDMFGIPVLSLTGSVLAVGVSEYNFQEGILFLY